MRETRGRTVAAVVGVFVALAAVAVVWGWLFGLDALTRFGSDGDPMTPNSALAFGLAGVALAIEQARGRFRYVGYGCALVVVAIGVASLVEHTAQTDLGIDQLFFSVHEPVGHPGRMAVMTAALFVVLGLTLVLLRARPRRGFVVSNALALLVALGAEIALLGHVYAIDTLRRLGTGSTMAVPAAVLAGVMAFGLLAARCTDGFVARVTESTHAAWLLRRLLVVAVVVPPALGGLMLVGVWQEWWESDEGLLGFTVAMTLIIVLVAVPGTSRLRRAEAKLEQRERLADARFEAAFLGGASGTAILSPDGVFQRVNPALEQVLERTELTLIGQPESAVTHVVDHPEDARLLAELLSGRVERTQREKRFVRPDGSEVWVSVSIAAVRGDDEACQYLIEQVVDYSDRRELEQRLAELALTDELTGLPNRTLLIDRLNQALRRSMRNEGQPALLYINLDHFSAINERFGVEAGDDVLRAVADRLTNAVRLGDTVARIGGDELVVLCELVADGEHISRIAERITDLVEQPVMTAGGGVVPSASVGVAVADATSTPESLLRDADHAMYVAKRRGRSRYEISL